MSTSPFETRSLITLATLVAHLALASIALARIHKSALAAPLALLCLDLFAFNAADAAHHLTGGPQWQWLDVFATSLLPPLAFDFVLAFVGRRRGRWRQASIACWILSGAIAGECLLGALGWRPLIGLLDPDRWSLQILPAGLAASVASLWLLWSHLRQSAAFAIERARTRLVIAAFAVGAAGNFGDLAANVGLTGVRLGPLGNFVATLLLATVALGFGLFERRASVLLLLTGLLAGLAQVAGYLAVFRYLGHRPTLAMVSLLTLTLAGYPLLASTVREWTLRRHQLAYHATLGRFAAQMAHDLRNPVAAIHGAAQLIDGERELGASLASVAEYLALILEQTRRIDRVIANYQRLGRVDPRRQPVVIADLVADLVAGQRLAMPPGITLEVEMEAGLPTLALDSDLVEGALENLVRNAVEALPGGGAVTVRARRGRRPERVIVEVQDSGPGIDPRLRDRLFSDFFTTKAGGSGLGLSFVRRVVEAHGGTVAIVSALGRGTTVRLELPLDPGATG